jgi:hypothetical protein
MSANYEVPQYVIFFILLLRFVKKFKTIIKFKQIIFLYTDIIFLTNFSVMQHVNNLYSVQWDVQNYEGRFSLKK